MPVLLICIPVLVALVACFFYRKPSKRLAQFIKDFQLARILVPLALLVFGFIGAFCLDLLDISEILFQNRELANERVQQFNRDLASVYNVQDPALTSIRAHIENITETIKPIQTQGTQTLLALGIGISGGLYLLLAAFATGAEHELTGELRSKEDGLAAARNRSEEIQTRFNTACQLLIQLQAVVGAKLLRFRRLISSIDLSSLKNADDKVRLLSDAFAPEPQFQAIVACAHQFCARSHSEPGSRLRVALFMPDENRLTVRASTDGNAENVVTSPNDKHRDYFETNCDLPRCVAVEAYKSKMPIVISNCETDARFKPFSESQKNRLKSMLACPLVHGNDDNLGVLVADSSAVDFFQESSEFKLLLEQMGSEIALRVMLEHCVGELLSIVNRDGGVS